MADIEDDWEPLDAFVQILMLGGGVHNVSEIAFQLLMEDINQNRLINVEDIYGSDCWIRPAMISSTRHWSKLSGARYRKQHPPEECDHE